MTHLAEALVSVDLPPWASGDCCLICGAVRSDLAPPQPAHDYRAVAVAVSGDTSCGSAALASCLEQKALLRSWASAHSYCGVSCPECSEPVALLSPCGGVLVRRQLPPPALRSGLNGYVRCSSCFYRFRYVAEPAGADRLPRHVYLPRVRGLTWCGAGQSCQDNCPSFSWRDPCQP
jgi:hypothetical protein